MKDAKNGYALDVMGVSGSGKTTVAELLAKHSARPLMEGGPAASSGQCREDAEGNSADRRRPLAMARSDRRGARKLGGRTKVWRADLLGAEARLSRSDQVERGRMSFFIYLKGSEALIKGRVTTRRMDIMARLAPAARQFDTLEEPTPDEEVVTVDAGGNPETEAAAVIAALNLAPSPPRQAGCAPRQVCMRLSRPYKSGQRTEGHPPSTVIAGLDRSVS